MTSHTYTARIKSAFWLCQDRRHQESSLNREERSKLSWVPEHVGSCIAQYSYQTTDVDCHLSRESGSTLTRPHHVQPNILVQVLPLRTQNPVLLLSSFFKSLLTPPYEHLRDTIVSGHTRRAHR